MKGKVSIGLDVGNRHINMVELTREAQGLKLLDFASVGLDVRQGKEEKLRQLEKLIQEKRIAALPVNIGVSGEAVIVRYIDLPKMEKPQLTQALQYEAQQYIPFRMEEVIFDSHILGPLSSDKSRMRVLLVAAKREAIMEFVGLIQQVRLKPNLIDLDSFSLINCFQKNGPEIKEGNVFALVNLEFDLVNINILQGRTPFFTRDISLLEDVVSLRQEKDENRGLFEAMRPLLANLIREIRLSIDYFESEFEKQVPIIYLSGEGAKLPELIIFFNTQLGREVSSWNPVGNFMVDSAQSDTDALKQTSNMLALASGLALRGMN